jgi:hypothetical protein
MFSVHTSTWIHFYITLFFTSGNICEFQQQCVMVKRHFKSWMMWNWNEITVGMHELINLLFNSMIIHQFQKKRWLKGKRKLFTFSSFKSCIGWLNDTFFVFNNLFTICFKYPSSHNSPISLFLFMFLSTQWLMWFLCELMDNCNWCELNFTRGVWNMHCQ